MAPNEWLRPDGDDVRPIPDPTELTTKALEREIEHLRELLDTKTENVLTVMQERFLRIEFQQQQNDKLRVEMKQDATRAVEAALTAQRDAVALQTEAFALATAKSEQGFAKQLEQLTETFKTEMGGLRRELDDTKTAVTTVTAQKVGAKEDRSGLYAGAAFLVGIVGMAVAVIAVVN